MIFHPYPGQLVRVHYRRMAGGSAYQDRIGVVVRVGRGPGPRNAEVLFADGARVVVPRGNLVAPARAGRPPRKERFLA